MNDNQIDDTKNFEKVIPNSSINQMPKMEILQFKNEVLSDIKKSQKLGEDKLEKFIEVIESKFIKYEEKLSKFSENLKEVTDTKSKDNILHEHVEDLLTFQAETRNNLITINVKLENLEKDIYNNVYRIDKILTESVLYPGIIGNMCKFKTFHDFMDYLLVQASQNITFRDKSEMDLKAYKIKMEKNLKFFSSQLDTLLKETKIFTKKNIEDAELRMKSLLEEVDEKIKSTRVDNAKFMKEFDKALEDVNNELININETKEEINKILEEKLSEIQEENNKIMDNYNENKNEFNLIKDRLTQLSEFIKDIKFRANMGKVTRRGEYINISNKIDFNNNQNLNEDDSKRTKKNKYESKIKKYIHGEINAEDLGVINTNIINSNHINNKISSRHLNDYNFIEEKRKSSNSFTNINKANCRKNSLEKSNEFSPKNKLNNSQIAKNKYSSKSNYFEDKNNSIDIKTNKNKSNTNLKSLNSDLNSIQKEINIKNDSYNNNITNKKIPKTAKIAKAKNARKEINIKTNKNKQITFNNKPKNRNPREINKKLKAQE